MKTITFLLVLSSFLFAGWVNGYVRADRRYVPGYYRTEANDIEEDNYSYTPKNYTYDYGYKQKTYSYDSDDSYDYGLKDFSTY